MLTIIKELGTLVRSGKSRCWVDVQCSECSVTWAKTKNDYNKNPSGFCIDCARKNRFKSQFEKAKGAFVDKVNYIHNNKYTYDIDTYTGALELMDVRCPIHGVFKIRPNNHLNAGQGCPTCGKESMALKQSQAARDTFSARSIQVHGNKYTYDNVDYKNSQTKVNITCSTHGDFLQRPNDHLNGHGCPKCTDLSDYDALYIWRVNNSSTFKIGVTSARLNSKRVKEVSATLAKANGIDVVPTIELLVHADNALELEKELHTKFTKLDKTINSTFGGYSEFRVLTEDELVDAISLVNRLKVNDIPRP
jgi:hypothetical protein